MKIDLQYLWSKLVQLLGSHKFWILLFAALAAYGLNIAPELKALIIFLAATVYSAMKTSEDNAQAKATTEALQMKVDYKVQTGKDIEQDMPQ